MPKLAPILDPGPDGCSSNRQNSYKREYSFPKVSTSDDFSGLRLICLAYMAKAEVSNHWSCCEARNSVIILSKAETARILEAEP